MEDLISLSWSLYNKTEYETQKTLSQKLTFRLAIIIVEIAKLFLISSNRIFLELTVILKYIVFLITVVKNLSQIVFLFETS